MTRQHHYKSYQPYPIAQAEIKYSQCWEDADILLSALNVTTDDVCLSIASAGANTLALLTQNPAKVIAIDTNPAQLACLELCVAAFRHLTHPELLHLVGSRSCLPDQKSPAAARALRSQMYRQLRSDLSQPAQVFWDNHQAQLEGGIGSIGKFERYFSAFRHMFLPLVHDRQTVEHLLYSRTPSARRRFYDRRWNSPRWQALFSFFFSRQVMGLLGRDQRCFAYAEGSIHERINAATRHALTELSPADNPYLQWILTGEHGSALPLWLRPEHFDTIKNNLDRLEWYQASLSEFLGEHKETYTVISKFNLSDIFEYMPEAEYHQALRQIVAASRPGARLVYWNMAVPRKRPATMSAAISPLADLAAQLHRQDKAFFYRDFVVEEIACPSDAGRAVSCLPR